METRHLRYFLAVVDHGSVSRASEWLGIAQPALSQGLGRMEKDLGVRLFERSRRGTRPRRPPWPFWKTCAPAWRGSTRPRTGRARSAAAAPAN